ncbi:MAG: hypothetical protein VX589_00800, partial [Myxococcota bacterium]|nr:hypothetical protein [Myxococcota bacterium]
GNDDQVNDDQGNDDQGNDDQGNDDQGNDDQGNDDQGNDDQVNDDQTNRDRSNDDQTNRADSMMGSDEANQTNDEPTDDENPETPVSPERDNLGGSDTRDNSGNDEAGSASPSRPARASTAGQPSQGERDAQDCRMRSAACSDGFTCQVGDDEMWSCVETTMNLMSSGASASNQASDDNGESINALGCACRLQDPRTAPSPIWFMGLVIAFCARRRIRARRPSRR